MEAGGNISGITETTRRAVADALVEGQQAGEGIPELARRLRALPAFGDARARLVARTELGLASNVSAQSSAATATREVAGSGPSLTITCSSGR